MAGPTNRKGSCQVCRHPERVRIEDLRASGVAFDVLAERFGLRKASIHKHWHEHTSAERKLSFLVGKSTIQQMRERAVEENLSLLDYLGIVRSTLVGQLMAQAEAGAAVAAATVAGRLLDVLRELGKLSGEIERADPATHVHLSVGLVQAPGFADLQAGLLQIARDHPSARADIIALIESLDGSQASRAPAPLLIEGTPVHA